MSLIRFPSEKHDRDVPLPRVKFCWARGKKARYKRKDRAHNAMVVVERRLKEPLSVYRCNTCGDWHFGHVKPAYLRLTRSA